MTSKMEQGRQYRTKTLRVLGRLGYATTRQIARSVWGDCSHSSRQMASRTICWLLGEGLIVAHQDTAADERMIALTAAGARQLAEWGEPIPGGKAHARDWLRHAHSHRTACNSVFSTAAFNLDEAGWTELEIRAGRAPQSLSRFTYCLTGGGEERKIPDVLLKVKDDTPSWVEVENTCRSSTDLLKLADFIRDAYNCALVSSVQFVIASPGATGIGRRIRKALTHGPESGYCRQVRELDALILESGFVQVSMLDHNELSLAPVSY